MTLDFNHRPIIANQINAHIDVAVQKARSFQPEREYLGASRLGVSCARALQYEYTKTPKDEDFSGRTLRIFEIGQPRTFVMDVGVQDELRQVKKTASDFDMGAVSAIMNTRPINDAVVSHWREKARNRKTVVFCSTVQHAEDVARSFNAAERAAPRRNA